MDTYIHEGIKVFYRVSMAILVLFQKYTANVNSQWSKDIQENGIDSALTKFCKEMPVIMSYLFIDLQTWKSFFIFYFVIHQKVFIIKCTSNFTFTAHFFFSYNDYIIVQIFSLFLLNLDSLFGWKVSPKKLLRVAFGIRGLSSAYIRRVFVKTEMTLKSRAVLNGSRQLLRSRSSENLPTSQSQLNIQMLSHTLTIREVTHIPHLFNS